MRQIASVFQLACEYTKLKGCAAELPELYPAPDAELKALVAGNCELLREYRQALNTPTADFCASTGLSIETLYRIEGGELDSVSLDDIETVLDTYASGSCP